MRFERTVQMGAWTDPSSTVRFPYFVRGCMGFLALFSVKSGTCRLKNAFARQLFTKQDIGVHQAALLGVLIASACACYALT